MQVMTRWRLPTKTFRMFGNDTFRVKLAFGSFVTVHPTRGRVAGKNIHQSPAFSIYKRLDSSCCDNVSHSPKSKFILRYTHFIFLNVNTWSQMFVVNQRMGMTGAYMVTWGLVFPVLYC